MSVVKKSDEIKIAGNHKWVWARMRELDGNGNIREMVFQVLEDTNIEDLTGDDFFLAGLPFVRTIESHSNENGEEERRVVYDSWALVRGVNEFNFMFDPQVFDMFSDFQPEDEFIKLVSQTRTLIIENKKKSK